MSGGVGPTSDICPTKEQELEHKESCDPSIKDVAKSTLTKPTAGFFSFHQLNALAVITILSASGMVSLEDFAFVAFSLFYIYFISKVAFPPQQPANETSVFNSKNRVLQLYVLAGAMIGLFLPIAYIFEGIVEGDQEGIKAAAPHVFLLASQVFMEGIAFADRFSTPVRVFVPVGYNSRRLFTILEWLRTEISKGNDDVHSGSERRLLVGRALAIANMAFWSFNLFGFLLPVYLPRAFKMYYSASKEKS